MAPYPEGEGDKMNSRTGSQGKDWPGACPEFLQRTGIPSSPRHKRHTGKRYLRCLSFAQDKYESLHWYDHSATHQAQIVSVTLLRRVISPVPDGLMESDLSSALKSIHADKKLLALEIVEYNPHHDRNNATAEAVRDICGSILGE
jgi:hypothetical protein